MVNPSQYVLLDKQRKVFLDTKNPPINNTHQIGHLYNGLFFLANNLRYIEIKRKKELGDVRQIEITPNFGNFPMESYFHWFTISSVNLLRLIALIEIMNINNWKSDDIHGNKDSIKKHCRSYVEEVIPEILLWRNKVAAHFAATDPFAADNIATIEQSVMAQVCYDTPYYYVGAYKWINNQQESQLTPWSLTKEFEKISSRVPYYYSIPSFEN